MLRKGGAACASAKVAHSGLIRLLENCRKLLVQGVIAKRLIETNGHSWTEV
jgi:hypothetical protein